MVSTLKAFMAAHRLTDINVVADAGMLSQKASGEIEAAGLGFGSAAIPVDAGCE